MRFEHGGIKYRLIFRREQVQPLSKEGMKNDRPARMQTQVQLMQVSNVGPKGDKDLLIELAKATVRGYFKDPVSREGGRKAALRRMTPFVAEALRPLMWDAYLNRTLEKK